ncbi:hypothetical protein CLOM_g18320 [Closterium sp. NIES-68]|nr:hypothetical protein CLOM_g18320 [Closterium sp. NIES-68]GJP65980.1 hypothetical protein CLOP_g22869 [Closterium sp. NIES-67]
MLPRNIHRAIASIYDARRMPRLSGVFFIALISLVSLISFSLWQSKCCRCLHGSRERTHRRGSISTSISSSSSSRIGFDGSNDISISSHVASGRALLNSTEDDRPFIYVYDLGPAYTDKILQLEPSWYSHQYDVEKYMTELLIASNAVRTVDPYKASLFFVPFFSARLTLYHFKDWDNNMRHAVEEASKVWTEILTTVRKNYPFFNRTNGRDHFSILTLDHGRCHSLTFVDPGLVGEMFFVTYNGDKLVRSIHASKERNMQAITYNYKLPVDASLPDIPCYMPDRDIVVPVLVAKGLPLVSPFEGERDKAVLFRFGAGQHHGVPIWHHGHQIRKELLELYKHAGYNGWDFAEKGEKETDPDWQRAVFCICPPGHSQWTSRPFKALMSGCIPVTFFREHDNPWGDELEYSSFSINVDPDNIWQLKERIDAVKNQPELVQRMQKNIIGVQELFRWTGVLDRSAESMLIRRLRKRATELRPFQLQMARERGIDEKLRMTSG